MVVWVCAVGGLPGLEDRIGKFARIDSSGEKVVGRSQRCNT